jgi:SPP1 family phage portal protein
VIFLDKVFKLPVDTVIDEQLVERLIKKHAKLVEFYTSMDKYYKGKHDIVAPNNSEYNKTIEVISNRTKYIVDIYNGYFLGSPIKLKCDDESLLDELENLDRINQANQVNRVISKNMAKYGHAFDLVFNDEEANVNYTYLDNKEVIYVYDNTILERPLFAVHYTNSKDFATEKSYVTGTVYTKNERISFDNKRGRVFFGERFNNPFNEVQITEYIENDERIGAIEPLASLQDGYNQGLSDKATANSYFADCYLKIVGVDLDEEDYTEFEDEHQIKESNKLVADLKQERIIYIPRVQDGAQPQIEFLSKPSNDTGEENLLDRIKDDMHTISHIPDFKNLSFSNTSAEAIRLAMWDLDNVCMEKEDNFKEGLHRRYKLISIGKNNVKLVDTNTDFEIDFIFSRNIPQNVTAELDNAIKARTFLSQETVLEMIPSVVPDVQSEIKRIEDEAKKNINNMFNLEGEEHDEHEHRHNEEV